MGWECRDGWGWVVVQLDCVVVLYGLWFHQVARWCHVFGTVLGAFCINGVVCGVILHI